MENTLLPKSLSTAKLVHGCLENSETAFSDLPQGLDTSKEEKWPTVSGRHSQHRMVSPIKSISKTNEKRSYSQSPSCYQVLAEMREEGKIDDDQQEDKFVEAERVLNHLQLNLKRKLMQWKDLMISKNRYDYFQPW